MYFGRRRRALGRGVLSWGGRIKICTWDPKRDGVTNEVFERQNENGPFQAAKQARVISETRNESWSFQATKQAQANFRGKTSRTHFRDKTRRNRFKCKTKRNHFDTTGKCSSSVSARLGDSSRARTNKVELEHDQVPLMWKLSKERADTAERTQAHPTCRQKKTHTPNKTPMFG